MVAAGLVLGGCGGGDEGGVTGSSAPTTSASASSVQAAPWAEEISTGDELWQVSGDGFTLTAYAMGEDTAQRESYYSDDVTNEPLVAAGDPVVFVNLVLTNTSDEVQYVATDQPKLLAAPFESPYAQQGVADITYATDSQWRHHDVWYHSVRVGSGVSSPYPLAPGESCARGYILPLGLGVQWAFIGAVWVYDGEDDPGHAVTFQQQDHTFG